MSDKTGGALYENKTVYTKPLLLKAYKLYLRHKSRVTRVALMVVGAAMLALAVYFAAAIAGSAGGNFSVAAIVMLAVMGLYFLVYSTNQHRLLAWMQGRALEKEGLLIEQRYSFTEDGFATKSAKTSSVSAWGEITGAVMGSDICLLMKGNSFQIVDLDGFTVGDADDFKSFVVGKVSRKKR